MAEQRNKKFCSSTNACFHSELPSEEAAGFSPFPSKVSEDDNLTQQWSNSQLFAYIASVHVIGRAKSIIALTDYKILENGLGTWK